MRAFASLSFVLAMFASTLMAAPTEHKGTVTNVKKGAPLKHRQSPYPFKQVVAFGDSLTDNGNG